MLFPWMQNGRFPLSANLRQVDNDESRRRQLLPVTGNSGNVISRLETNDI